MTQQLTSNITLSDLTSVVDAHLAAYCEPDAARRAQMVEQIWAPDGQLVDPPIQGAGHDGITALGDVVQAHYAGHRFERTSAVDTHNGYARYEWLMRAPSGDVALVGTDVVEVDEAGRLVKIVGFFGPTTPVS